MDNNDFGENIISVTMCMEADFIKWKKGQLIFDMINEELVPMTPEIQAIKDEIDEKQYMTYANFKDWSWIVYDTFEKSFITPQGEKVYAFGFSGYNE